MLGPDRKRGCLGYRGFFSPTFINPCFRYSPIVNIENWDFKNPRFPTSVFSIFTYGEYWKHGCLKISDFKHLSKEYRKLRFQKILGFQTSVFSIFIYSEYRKRGCLKISDFKHLSSEYRKLRFQKIRGFQTSVFSIFTYSEYRKHGCLKISDFLKSKFSIFTIGEYRKHGFIKVGEKKSVISAISEKSAFLTWPICLWHLEKTTI